MAFDDSLADRVRDVRVIDRYVRGITGTWEHVLSLSLTTDPQSGLVVILMSVDMVQDRQTAGMTPLAQYPVSQQSDSEADARLIASKYGLSIRKAHSGTGWAMLQLAPEDTAPTDREILIGV